MHHVKPPISSVPVELAVAPGLADLALNELREIARRSGLPIPAAVMSDDAVALDWPGEVRSLHALRTVQYVSRVWRFEVPRPKALLGDAALRELSEGLVELSAAGEAGFSGLRLSAAGRDSSVMQRLALALAESTGLPLREDGDLLVRVRPGAASGWEVLARTTPRPLSVRAWRVCDRPGGLDAGVAAALVRWAGVRDEERVCNPMLGSGTLLIERAVAGPAACLHGFDVDPEALRCAERNASAAAVLARLRLWQGDATEVAPEHERYHLLLVDPPWGDAVGDPQANAALYAGLLRASARRCLSGGRMVLVTQEVRLIERLLSERSGWVVRQQRRVWHGGHRPVCLLLERLPLAV